MCASGRAPGSLSKLPAGMKANGELVSRHDGSATRAEAARTCLPTPSDEPGAAQPEVSTGSCGVGRESVPSVFLHASSGSASSCRAAPDLPVRHPRKDSSPDACAESNAEHPHLTGGLSPAEVALLLDARAPDRERSETRGGRREANPVAGRRAVRADVAAERVTHLAALAGAAVTNRLARGIVEFALPNKRVAHRELERTAHAAGELEIGIRLGVSGKRAVKQRRGLDGIVVFVDFRERVRRGACCQAVKRRMPAWLWPWRYLMVRGDVVEHERRNTTPALCAGTSMPDEISVIGSSTRATSARCDSRDSPKPPSASARFRCSGSAPSARTCAPRRVA